MANFYDMCNTPVEVTDSYICYRNRLIDMNSIVSFQTKGKRLMINSYRQNSEHPTMLIMFANKEDAQSAFQKMKTICYSNNQQYKVTQSTLVEPIVPPPTPSTVNPKPSELTGHLGFLVASICLIAYVFSLSRL